MSEVEQSVVFKTRTFACKQYPFLTVHVSRWEGEGRDKEDRAVECKFENGIYIADTKEKLADILDGLNQMKPGIRSIIKEVAIEEAFYIGQGHQQARLRENAAIRGPFQTDNMITRTPVLQEHAAMKEAAANGQVITIEEAKKRASEQLSGGLAKAIAEASKNRVDLNQGLSFGEAAAATIDADKT